MQDETSSISLDDEHKMLTEKQALLSAQLNIVKLIKQCEATLAVVVKLELQIKTEKELLVRQKVRLAGLKLSFVVKNKYLKEKVASLEERMKLLKVSDKTPEVTINIRIEEIKISSSKTNVLTKDLEILKLEHKIESDYTRLDTLQSKVDSNTTKIESWRQVLAELKQRHLESSKAWDLKWGYDSLESKHRQMMSLTEENDMLKKKLEERECSTIDDACSKPVIPSKRKR